MSCGNVFSRIVIAFFAIAPLASAQEADHSQHQHEVSPPVANTLNAADADTSSQTEHVAPEPAAHVMGDMSYKSMVSMMQMDDTALFGRVMFDQLEWRNTSNGDAAVWDAQAWYGGDYSKVLLKTEGEQLRDTTEDASVELLWDRIFARWWSVQAGVREDFGKGPSRTWVAIGVEGLAPYWFDIEATLYVGDAGRTAMRVSADYDMLLTQRLTLRAEIEASLYGKDDPECELGAGLSTAEIALRLRYEIRREFAPYLGVVWQGKFSGTADYARAAAHEVSDVQAVAGVRIWF